MTRNTVTVDSGGRDIEVSRPDKVLFPDARITKLDLAEYWARIAGTALPLLEGRPLTLRRFPDGIEAEGFFQKHAPDHFPDWIERVTIPKQDGTVSHVVAREAGTLVYLSDQGCLEVHVGLSLAGAAGHPDRMVFDLDPSDGDFGKVQEVAHAVRDALHCRDLPCFVMTTGSRGLHVVLPLDGSGHVDSLRPFARSVAREVADAHPSLATTEQRKAARGDRVLVDTFRTAFGQTAIAPYSPRARSGAPVATPLRWDEAFSSDLRPDGYTIASIFRRLGQMDDPWGGFGAEARCAAHLTF